MGRYESGRRVVLGEGNGIEGRSAWLSEVRKAYWRSEGTCMLFYFLIKA